MTESGSLTSVSTRSNPRCGGRLIPGHIASAILFIAFVLIAIAFILPDWLAVNDAIKPTDMKFRKLGLWLSCYNELHDPYWGSYWTNGYDGCRWIYYPVLVSFYDIKEYVIPSFLVPVQITYTLCLATVIVALIMVIAYLIKFSSKDDGLVHYLIALGMLINMSALLGEVAVIVFGSLSTSRTWAANWQFNYLSWGFVVAVVGIVLLHLSGIFFLLEASLQWRKRKRRQRFRVWPIPQTPVKLP